MATEKQIKYVQSLQEHFEDEGYSKQEIEKMNNQEVSNVIDELKKAISEDELYNECMAYGLPNQWGGNNMDRLEELVNGMNKNIVKGNLVEVDKYIKSLHDEGYIDKRNATFY